MKNWLILLSLGFIFVACEDKEDDEIYSAQVCIDRSTQATVDACLTKISSHTSQRAYVLKCAADFIRAGMDTPTIVQAIVNIDENSNSNAKDPSLEFYQKFTFADSDDAVTAVNNCAASGSKNLSILALSAQAATEMNFLAGNSTIEAWIAGLPRLPDPNPSDGIPAPIDISLLDDTTMQTLGNSIIQTEAAACGENGTYKKTEICDNLIAAKEQGQTDLVGNNSLNLAKQTAKAFLELLEQPNN